jgi:hypothetical protein
MSQPALSIAGEMNFVQMSLSERAFLSKISRLRRLGVGRRVVEYVGASHQPGRLRSLSCRRACLPRGMSARPLRRAERRKLALWQRGVPKRNKDLVDAIEGPGVEGQDL